MKSFADKHIIVTGGVKGIGRSAAEIFVREGGNVSILDVDPSGKSFEETAGGKIKFFECDMAKATSIQECIDLAIRNYGEVDVLVNNAGINRYATVTETTEELWDTVMNINLKGVFLASKYSIPSMQKKGKGVVINVSSVQAFISQSQVAAYTTSKTALLGLTRSIAVDYAPEIRCVAVCPGTINTPMLQAAIRESPNPEEVFHECEEMHLLKKVGDPTEVGEFIVYLASDKASFITGQAFRIDGGLGISIGGSKRT
ncbi:MAG TPA: SDR family oxidoreductase [Cyclobacteriaceae bacterium]|nr:SDR family oxidoreductase [Cyclobacteriaceae bacterium]HNU40980.1 SDR family oxidoreductase [Cyclobacteriaceae bacterium]